MAAIEYAGHRCLAPKGRVLTARATPSDKFLACGHSIACYCALVTDDMRAGLILAVNHSGESDSTGAIAGNLIGVRSGVESLPTDLLDGLAERELVEAVATDLANAFLDDAKPDFARYPPW